MPPFVAKKHQNQSNGSVDEDFNYEVSILAAAKKTGLSFEELNLLTLNDFFDYVDMWMGEDKEIIKEATQEDIDYFYRYM